MKLSLSETEYVRNSPAGVGFAFFSTGVAFCNHEHLPLNFKTLRQVADTWGDRVQSPPPLRCWQDLRSVLRKQQKRIMLFSDITASSTEFGNVPSSKNASYYRAPCNISALRGCCTFSTCRETIYELQAVRKHW